MARKYDSEETKQKILSSSVRLFIEKGYHETTMTEILHDAGVSGSSFHSIFHTKDGVLAELTEFMFENQFGVAENIIGTELCRSAYTYPVYWKPSKTHTMANTIVAARYEVISVDLTSKKIDLEKRN